MVCTGHNLTCILPCEKPQWRGLTFIATNAGCPCNAMVTSSPADNNAFACQLQLIMWQMTCVHTHCEVPLVNSTYCGVHAHLRIVPIQLLYYRIHSYDLIGVPGGQPGGGRLESVVLSLLSGEMGGFLLATTTVLTIPLLSHDRLSEPREEFWSVEYFLSPPPLSSSSSGVTRRIL